MNNLKWLTVEKNEYNDSNYYLLSEMKAKYEVVELGNDGYLVLNWDKENLGYENEPIHLEFAVFSFNSCDDKDTWLNLQFHGNGPSGSLKECRHTYWGEAGYIFYPNGKVISLAFKELSKYFNEVY